MWIPPDSDEETVFHELGHRYGHYHNDNLSEEFAEWYRMAHRPLKRSAVHLDKDNTARNILIAAGIVGIVGIIFRLKTKNH
jgi:hypothetical protein